MSIKEATVWCPDHLNTPRLHRGLARRNTEPFGDSVPNEDPSSTGTTSDFPLGLSVRPSCLTSHRTLIAFP